MNNYSRFLCLLALLLTSLAQAQTACGRLYVDSAVTTSGNGSSWATAFKTVTQALDSANSGTCIRREIWITKGTYYPMQSLTAVASSRDSSFRILRNGIRLYGGFAGNETGLSARNVVTNPTLLSGDIGIIGGSTDNSYHVVTVVSNSVIDTNTRIDGLTIKGGNANGLALGPFPIAGQPIYPYSGGGIYNFSSSPFITNCTFSSNIGQSTGGGMCNVYCSPAVTNCTFSANTSIYGGGMYNSYSSPAVTNCTFSANTASGGSSLGFGGGMYNSYSSPAIANCIFSSNTSPSGGGVYNDGSSSPAITNSTFSSNSSNFGSGVYNSFSFPLITNCILWGNPSANGGSIFNSSGGNATISYTTTETAYAGAGNSTANPLFVNAANAIGPDGLWRTSDDGLQLTPCSPAINTGHNAALPAGITTDITGAVRIENAIVDRGAYETPYNSVGGSTTTVAMSPANPVCNTTSITFTATIIAPGSIPVYQWYKNGVAVGSNQTTYTSSGSWNNNDSVWMVHTNNDCSANDTSNKSYVQLVSAPAQPGTITGSISPCTGTQIYSVSAVTGAATYTWTVPAGWVITAGQGTTSITVTSTSAAGNVTVTANNSCGVASAVRTLIVMPLTAPATPTGPVAVCASSTGNVYSIPSVLGATIYTWTAPAGWVITAGQGTPSITVTAASGNTSGNISVTSGNGCQTSGGASLAVSGSSVVPSLIMGSNSGSSICAGTPVTFTAVPTNGGTAPSHQWKKNGTNVGTNSTIYTDASLANGDIITVTLTTNSSCASVSSVTASGPAITVVPTVVPAISISGSSPLILCAGASNTFTANSSNGGAAPTYQWYKNGTALAGATGTSYTGSGFANNDSISVVLTSTAACRLVDTVRSSSVKLAVYANVVPTLIVGSNSGNSICPGTSVTFTAAPTNGGTLLSYQWKKNGVNVGTNSATYTISSLVTGDIITVVLTSISPCAATASVTASGPPIMVLSSVAPAITINGASALVLCAGSSHTFISSSAAGGPNPTYQWYINGTAIPGANAATYTGSGFADNDSISVVLTSSAICRLVDTVRSNRIQLTVYPSVVPVVTVAAAPGTGVPAGTPITFTASVTATGTTPTYQWYKNGVAIAGATGNTYTTSTLEIGDLISVQVASLGPCANPNSVTSVPLLISSPAGIQTVNGSGGWQESLFLYPNPNRGRFTVTADWGTISAGERVQVTIVNGLGQSVFSNEVVPQAKWSLEIQLAEGVANGLYMLLLQRQSDGSTLARPVIIQR